MWIWFCRWPRLWALQDLRTVLRMVLENKPSARGRIVTPCASPAGEWLEPTDKRFWIGPTEHIQWGKNCKPVFAFGRYKGKTLSQVANGPHSRNYMDWITQGDFPPHVHDLCRKAAMYDAHQFIGQVKKTYPPPADLSEALSAPPKGEKKEKPAPQPEPMPLFDTPTEKNP